MIHKKKLKFCYFFGNNNNYDNNENLLIILEIISLIMISTKIMNIYLIVLFISVLQTQAYWQLKWIDQFNNKSIDSSKWDVTNETQGCDGNHYVTNFD